VLFVSALLVACGSDPVSKDDAGGGGTSGTGASGGTSGTGGGALCPNGPGPGSSCPAGPGYFEESPEIEAGSVNATIVDAEGAPIPDLMVFICGTLVCSSPERTDENGYVTIGFSRAMVEPAFKYGDGLEFGRFAVPLPESTVERELGTIATPRLPSPGECLEPGRTVQSGGVSLTLAEDAKVEVLALDYPEPDDRTFRAAELPLELSPPALAAGEGLDAVFALAPTGAVVCPPATVELPNTPGYPPGTEVELLVHGVDIEEDWAPYAGWAVFATGRVDDAGERIRTVDGGLSMISDIGVRAR
jgi:hypothetical protein